MLFRIRVDEVNRNVQEKLSALLLGNEHVLVKHVLPHGNPHFHAYAELDYNSHQALRYQIDKRCQTKDASERSVTACDPERRDEFIQYLFNTKHGNVWKIVSSTIDTTDHQAKAARVSEDFAIANPPKDKKKQITMWELAMETNQVYLIERVSLLSADLPLDVARAYARAAVKVCRKHHKVMCEYTLHKIVQTAMTEQPNYSELVVNAVVRRMTPRE